MTKHKTKNRKSNLKPKPWRLIVLYLQVARYRERMSWTRERWERHDDERAARRQAPKRPRLMAIRLQRLEREREFQARSQRMLAYHARRRAALATAAKSRADGP